MKSWRWHMRLACFRLTTVWNFFVLNPFITKLLKGATLKIFLPSFCCRPRNVVALGGRLVRLVVKPALNVCISVQTKWNLISILGTEGPTLLANIKTIDCAYLYIYNLALQEKFLCNSYCNTLVFNQTLASINNTKEAGWPTRYQISCNLLPSIELSS